jgi:serine/threonine protein kinase
MISSSSIGGAIVPERCDCRPGDLVGAKYYVEKELGQGSFGVVYKVKDIGGNVWALKLLRLWDVPSTIRQPLVSRFEMEYKTSCIRSRNLVHSVDSGFLKGNPYIVMEFCDGGDLAQYVGKSNINLNRIAADVLNGLNDLHVNGKVHRDLKPENVLFKADGTAVLTDFGISGDRNKRMTERNIFGKPTQIFGTYAYMPPEQVNRARGNSTVLPTTDMFSFGVMMYQLITGELPFGKLDDQNDLVRYQKRGKVGDWDRGRLLSVPGGSQWVNLITRCLVPDLKDRIRSANEAISMIPGGNIMPYAMPAAPVENRVQPDSRNAGRILKVMQGKEYGKEYNLDELLLNSGRRLMTIGRDMSNTIVVDDYSESYMSRRHCTIENIGSTYWQIRDGQWDAENFVWKNSMNGTYVNSDMVGQTGILLNDGDIITIGDVKLKYYSK